MTPVGTLTLSSGHYLYVNDGRLVQAGLVKVGDFLETADGTPAVITGKTVVHAIGLYNPHTLHGDILVNGFRTTTYTNALSPLLAHALLAPVRALYIMNATVA